MGRATKRERAARLAEWATTFALAAVLATLLRRAFLVVTVTGTSMEPTLRAGDCLLARALPRRGRAPRRGAIVVLAPFPPRRGPSIKRLIGLPGERSAVRAGRVTIDGVPLHEPYLHDAPDPARVPQDRAVLLLGAGEYYVLGDHRAVSVDSRAHGPVRREAIIGVAWQWTRHGSRDTATPRHR